MGKKRNKRILRLKRKPKSRTAPGESRNWLELPQDVTVSILARLGAVEILGSAQKVCMAWRNICKDPLMWRTIDMRNDGHLGAVNHKLDKMCLHAVDRSSGNLVDINIERFGTDFLLGYMTNSCHGIRRLRLVSCYGISDEGFRVLASELPLLEELDISLCALKSESLEAVGRGCPLLKSLKFNGMCSNFSGDLSGYYDFFGYYTDVDDKEAQAIAGTMPGLYHLQLFGNKLSNDGLREILDCCPHLESLDLRHCFNLDLERDLGIRCAERIKNLLLPNDSIGKDEFFATVCHCGSCDCCRYVYSEDSYSDDNEF